MTRRARVLLPVVALALAVGCAAPAYEEAARAEADPSADEPAFEDEKSAPPPASAPAEEPAASLAELQRELETNNAKLRELGVPLELADGGAEASEEQIKQESKGDGVGAGSTATPGGVPAAKPAAPSAPDSKPAKRKESKRPSSKSDKSKDAGGGLDDVTPAPAKAAPLGPSGDARDQDAAARCQQICDLSEISCSLGQEICELADRHPGEDDYAAACERANLDCDAAKEACDVCVE